MTKIKAKKTSKKSTSNYKGNIPSRSRLLIPKFAIWIGGKRFREDMLKFVSKVEVVKELDKLPEATIEVKDYENKWLRGSGIGKGHRVTIAMGHGDKLSTEFRGKISYIDVAYPQEGVTTLTIYLVSKGVALSTKERSKTYKNRKVSSVIRDMHKKRGMKIDIHETKKVHKKLSQSTETDLAFILRWKEKLGWKYYEKTDGTMYFGPKSDYNVVRDLGYRTGGMEVISFTPTYEEIEKEDDDSSSTSNKDGKTSTTKSTKKKKTKAKSSGSHKSTGKA